MAVLFRMPPPPEELRSCGVAERSAGIADRPENAQNAGGARDERSKRGTTQPTHDCRLHVYMYLYNLYTCMYVVLVPHRWDWEPRERRAKRDSERGSADRGAPGGGELPELRRQK